MSGTFRLLYLVQETVSGYYGVLGFLVAFSLVVVVIARWSQPSTVSTYRPRTNPQYSRSSILIRFPAGCDTYGRISQLAWLVVDWFQVSD